MTARWPGRPRVHPDVPFPRSIRIYWFCYVLGTNTAVIANPLALPRAEWKTIGLVAAGLALTPVYNTAFALATIPIVTDLDIRPSEFVVVVQVYAVAAGAVLFPAGMLADRIGAGAVFLAGLALPPAGLALAAAFPGYWSFMGYGLLRGLGEGAVWSAGYVVLATCIGPERRGRAFGIRNLCILIGMIIAVPAIGPLISLGDWQTSFAILGAVGVVFATLAVRFRDALRDTALQRPRETGNPERMRTGFRTMMLAIASWPVLLFLLALTFKGFSNITEHPAFNVIVEGSKVVRSTPVDGGPGIQVLALLLVLPALIVPPLAGGVMADMARNRERLVATCLVSCAILLGIAALDIIPLPTAIWLGLGGLLAVLAGPSIDLLVLRICPSGRIGAVFGFVATGGSIGGWLAIWGAGSLTASGMPGTVLWLSALAVLLCVVSIYAARAVAR